MTVHIPHPGSLEKLHRQLQTYYTDMTSKMNRADMLYNQRVNHLMLVPEGIAVHESSTAAQIVDGLRDQIRTDEPSVSVVRSTTDREGTDKDNKRIRWGQYVLDEINEHAIVSIAQQILHDSLLRGAGCTKYVIDTDALPDPPERNDFKSVKAFNLAMKDFKNIPGNWPWVNKPIDPLSVFPAPGTRRPHPFMLEVQTRRALDMWVDYPNWKDSKRGQRGGDSPMRTVIWREYWSDDHYIAEADGNVVFDKANPYGFVPYEFEYSGLGRFNTDGNPSFLAKSILDDIAGELEEEIRMKTAQSAQWLFHTFPRLLTEEDPKKARKQYMKGPGAIIQVADMTRKPQWLAVPEPNPAMLIFLQEIEKNIFRKAPAALSERPAGVDAAVHQALLIGQAVKIIGPVKSMLNRLASQMLTNMARQLVKLDITMHIPGSIGDTRSMTITPKDLAGVQFRVKYEATDPVENDRRMLAGLALLRVPGLLSKQTYREVYGKGIIPDNKTEEVRLLTELVIDQLAATGALLQPVLEEIAAREQSAGLQSAEEAILAQIAGGEGPAPAPGGGATGAVERGVEESGGLATGAASREGADTALEGI